MKSSLDEAATKYSSFKSRVKQYKQHKETKEEKYKEHITKSEEDFRTKLIALRDKMQNAYDTKLYEVQQPTYSYNVLNTLGCQIDEYTRLLGTKET